MKGKLGPAKRFGTRYGAPLKQKLAKIEIAQKAAHKCPDCAKARVVRLSYGIWQCGACGLKFASRAYTPAEARPVVELVQAEIHEATPEVAEAVEEEFTEEEDA